jgi:putative oxidoreductase
MIDSVVKNMVVPVLLRFALAVVFIYHGLSLVSPEKQWGAGWMPEATPQPAAVQLAVAWGQLIGGIAMALGFLTRLAALGLAIIMVGAIYLVHLPNGFDISSGGFEYNFVLIVICAALLLTGGGSLAVERLFRLKPRTPGR